MRVAHLPFGYYPDPVGGTEIYVRTLAAAQRDLGHEPFVIAPGASRAAYPHDDLMVYRYPVESVVTDVAELYAARTSVDVTAFAEILDESRPDVLHVHGYGRAVSRELLDTARARGIPIVFTYHTPTATCVRGTLMRWGRVACEGVLDAQTCAACSLHARGVPRVLSLIASRMPPVKSTRLAGTRLGTGLRLRQLVELRHTEIRDFLRRADHIVATSEWVLRLLDTVGVPRSRVTLNRQGTLAAVTPAPPRRADSNRLELAFFGRFDRTKGLDIIIDALRLIANTPLELHVYGISQGADAYSRSLEQKIHSDARIVMHPAVAHEALLDTMRMHDLLVVPSQWLETGPLVVLEAFAAGLPVLGSRLGGIAELVRDGVDGLLVEPQDVKAWAGTIERLATRPELLAQLRSGVRAPRTMTQVAADMEAVYASVLRAA